MDGEGEVSLRGGIIVLFILWSVCRASCPNDAVVPYEAKNSSPRLSLCNNICTMPPRLNKRQMRELEELEELERNRLVAAEDDSGGIEQDDIDQAPAQSAFAAVSHPISLANITLY